MRNNWIAIIIGLVLAVLGFLIGTSTTKEKAPRPRISVTEINNTDGTRGFHVSVTVPGETGIIDTTLWCQSCPDTASAAPVQEKKSAPEPKKRPPKKTKKAPVAKKKKAQPAMTPDSLKQSVAKDSATLESTKRPQKKRFHAQFSNEMLVEKNDTVQEKVLDHHSEATFTQGEGFSQDSVSAAYAYTDSSGQKVVFKTFSGLSGDKATLYIIKEVQGKHDTVRTIMHTMVKDYPLDADKVPSLYDMYRETHMEGDIDLELNKKGNRQIWTGVGLEVIGIGSHFLLHRQKTPVLQTVNGMDYFDKDNPFYDENLKAKNTRTWLYIWEGGTYAAQALGGYLIWRGHINKNASFSLTPASITFTMKLQNN